MKQLKLLLSACFKDNWNVSNFSSTVTRLETALIHHNAIHFTAEIKSVFIEKLHFCHSLCILYFLSNFAMKWSSMKCRELTNHRSETEHVDINLSGSTQQMKTLIHISVSETPYDSSNIQPDILVRDEKALSALYLPVETKSNPWKSTFDFGSLLESFTHENSN